MQTKAWARQQGINDASRGTFNSYALTLMVLHHLQTVQPPVMPTLSNVLFDLRPLQDGQPLEPTFPIEDVQQHCRHLSEDSFGAANTQSAAALFLSFLVRYMALTQAWATGPGEMVRVSTFQGQLREQPFSHAYMMLVEDPFDSSDNAARSMGTWSKPSAEVDRVTEAFRTSAEGALSLPDERAVHAFVKSLFGGRLAPMPVVEDAPAQGAGRGRGQRAPGRGGRGRGGRNGARGRSGGRSGAGKPARGLSRSGTGATGSGRGRGTGAAAPLRPPPGLCACVCTSATAPALLSWIPQPRRHDAHRLSSTQPEPRAFRTRLRVCVAATAAKEPRHMRRRTVSQAGPRRGAALQPG